MTNAYAAASRSSLSAYSVQAHCSSSVHGVAHGVSGSVRIVGLPLVFVLLGEVLTENQSAGNGLWIRVC